MFASKTPQVLIKGSSDVLLAIPAYDGNEMVMTIMRHSARILMQLQHV